MYPTHFLRNFTTQTNKENIVVRVSIAIFDITEQYFIQGTFFSYKKKMSNGVKIIFASAPYYAPEARYSAFSSGNTKTHCIYFDLIE